MLYSRWSNISSNIAHYSQARQGLSQAQRMKCIYAHPFLQGQCGAQYIGTSGLTLPLPTKNLMVCGGASARGSFWSVLLPMLPVSVFGASLTSWFSLLWLCQWLIYSLWLLAIYSWPLQVCVVSHGSLAHISVPILGGLLLISVFVVVSFYLSFLLSFYGWHHSSLGLHLVGLYSLPPR